jgi:hypothetical protein
MNETITYPACDNEKASDGVMREMAPPVKSRRD